MKHLLRQDMKSRLAAIGPEHVRTRSEAACERLAALPEFRQADVVMLYLPIPLEVDTAVAALAAWQAGKTVLVPKVSWEQKHMIAVTCRSFEDNMEHLNHGLRHPADGEPWPLEGIDLVVVPALAFDRAGRRLGRGGGFYDRFLARPEFRGNTCGLAFAEQLVDELPCHDHDVAVNMLVTDQQVLRFAETAGAVTEETLA